MVFLWRLSKMSYLCSGIGSLSARLKREGSESLPLSRSCELHYASSEDHCRYPRREGAWKAEWSQKTCLFRRPTLLEERRNGQEQQFRGWKLYCFFCKEKDWYKYLLGVIVKWPCQENNQKVYYYISWLVEAVREASPFLLARNANIYVSNWKKMTLFVCLLQRFFVILHQNQSNNPSWNTYWHFAFSCSFRRLCQHRNGTPPTNRSNGAFRLHSFPTRHSSSQSMEPKHLLMLSIVLEKYPNNY